MQALADFIVEYSTLEKAKAEDKVEVEVGPKQNESETQPFWMVHNIDGSFNAGACRARLILASLEDIVAQYILRFNCKISNNEVEYEVLITRLRLAHDILVTWIKIYNDSHLVLIKFEDIMKPKI